MDRLTDETGQALYLAESLVGPEVFWATIKAVIQSSVRLDADDDDLSKAEAKKLLELLASA